jgi:hypothetical protein
MTGFLVNLFLRNRLFTVGAFLFFLIGLIIINNPAVWIALVVALSAGLSQFSHWYYNERLLCIRDRIAPSAVISPPAAPLTETIAEPDTRAHGQRTLLKHCSIMCTNEAMLIDNARWRLPFHTSPPALPVAAA